MVTCALTLVGIVNLIQPLQSKILYSLDEDDYSDYPSLKKHFQQLRVEQPGQSLTTEPFYGALLNKQWIS